MGPNGMSWASRIAVALILLASAPVRAGEKNAHFLDRKSGQAAEVLLELENRAKGPNPDAKTLADLGWMHLLYGNDPPKASARFREALSKDPSTSPALDGLLASALWIGDGEGAGLAMLESIRSAPGSPGAVVLVRNADPLPTWHNSVAQRVKALSEVLENAPPELAFWIRKELSRLLWNLGKNEEAFRIWKLNGTVPEWFCLGYLGEGGDACFDDVLAPERGPDLAAVHKVGLEKVRWKRVSVTAHDEELGASLGRELRGEGHVVFLLTFVRVPEAVHAEARTSMGASHKVFVNGRLVGVADRFATLLPRHLAFPVALRAGWNTILVKVASRRASALGRTCLALTGPDFEPIEGLDISTGFTPDEAPFPPPRKDDPPPAFRKPEALDRLRSEVSDPATRTVPGCLWLAGLLKAEGLKEEARGVFEMLLEAHGECPLVRWVVADFERTDWEYLTDDERRSRSRQGFEKASAAPPVFLPALLSLAEIESRKDKVKALDLYLKAAELRPGSFDVLQGLVGTYIGLDWKAEARASLKEMERLHPDRPQTHFAWADWYGRLGNELERLRCTEEALAAMGSTSKGWLFRSWERLGMWDQLARYYGDRSAKRPRDAGIRGHLAKALWQLGFLDESRRALEEARRIDPEGRWIPGYEAELEALAGNEEGVHRAFEAMVGAPARLRIYDHDARACLAESRGARDNIPAAYRVDSEEVVRNAPAPDAFEKVSSVVLFEQKVVRFFGKDLAASVEHVHKIVLILNKRAGEEYGRIYMPDEIEEARVFCADGRVLEPDPVQEGRFIALPALDRGQIIEYRIVRRKRIPPPAVGIRRVFTEARFRREDERVLRFRLVLILPEDADVRMRKKHLDAEPEVKKSDGMVEYVWDLSDLLEFKRERMMPPFHDILPSLTVYQGAPSSRLVERELCSRWMKSNLSEFVRKKARELCEGKETPLEKLRALYGFCVSEIKAGHGNPIQTIRKKEGSIEKTFVALARAAGFRPEQAHYRKVPNFYTDWDFTPLRFDGTVIHIPMEEGSVFLQPGRYVPFGVLPPHVSFAEALRVSREGCSWIRLPSCEAGESTGSLRARVTLSADGTAEVEGDLVLGGVLGAQIRSVFEERMSKPMRDMALRRIVNQVFKRIRVSSVALLPFDLEQRNAVITFKGTVRNFAVKKEDSLTFRAVRTPSGLSARLARETRRRFPAIVDMGPQGLVGLENVTYVFPQGTRLAPPENRVGGGEFGKFAFTCETTSTGMVVRREVYFRQVVVAPHRWGAFCAFCREVDDLEQRSVRAELLLE